MDIIFTTYFTQNRKFSQHDCSLGCKPNDFKVMRKWYESIWRLKLNAIIFHNELSCDFMSKYETKNIKFERWSEFNRPSYNDERFYCYLEYLKMHENIKRGFCTDMFDVVFYKNPFELVDDQYDLYLGSEASPSRTWNRRKYKEVKLPQPNIEAGQTYFNAGIIGGDRSNLMKLFSMMIETFKKVPTNVNANMPVYNYCLHNIFNGKYFTGSPLHNKFKSGKIKDGIYIKHK